MWRVVRYVRPFPRPREARYSSGGATWCYLDCSRDRNCVLFEESTGYLFEPELCSLRGENGLWTAVGCSWAIRTVPVTGIVFSSRRERAMDRCELHVDRHCYCSL